MSKINHLDETGNPAFPQIIEGRDKMTIRFGKTEVVQTAEAIKIRVRCKSRPGFGVADDLNK